MVRLYGEKENIDKENVKEFFEISSYWFIAV